LFGLGIEGGLEPRVEGHERASMDEGKEEKEERDSHGLPSRCVD
jgi:hypothetical protein